MRELLRANGQLFEQPGHACPDEDVILVLTDDHAGNGHTFIPLILVPGNQFVLTKLRLIRNALLHLDHFEKFSLI